MNRIKQVSLFFRIIFQIVFSMLPILLLISWLYAPQELVLMRGMIVMEAIPSYYKNASLHPLSVAEKLPAFVISLIPLCITLFILYSLIKLFRLYERGEIFSLEHVKRIRNIGYVLLIGQIINPFYQLALGAILTLNNPPGHHFMSITLDQTNVGLLLTGFLVVLVSWIVAEGCKLRDEQQLTI